MEDLVCALEFIRVGNVVDLTLEWLEKRCLYAWTVNPIISVLPLVYPAGASATLNSEIFIQSDRLAALVLMGIQRWLLFAVLGLVFPFLIVSITNVKLRQTMACYKKNCKCCF